MDGLDGYLAALIIGPRFFDPRQWIALFVGQTALMAAPETPEARAIQTLAANYNRISAALAETPARWHPRFVRREDARFDPFFWSTGFLLGTGFAPRLWRPALQGHPDTGDIIAPIRITADAKVLLNETEVAAVIKGGRRHPFSLHAKAHQGSLLSEPPLTSPDQNSVVRSSRLRLTGTSPASPNDEERCREKDEVKPQGFRCLSATRVQDDRRHL